jgi:hypothetical protein
MFLNKSKKNLKNGYFFKLLASQIDLRCSMSSSLLILHFFFGFFFLRRTPSRQNDDVLQPPHDNPRTTTYITACSCLQRPRNTIVPNNFYRYSQFHESFFFRNAAWCHSTLTHKNKSISEKKLLLFFFPISLEIPYARHYRQTDRHSFLHVAR